MNWLSALWHRRAPAGTGHRHLRRDPVPAAICAVGDVHGRLDLYAALEARIAARVASRAASEPGGALVVLLGDVIDRGPDTAGLIDHLLAPPPPGLERLVLRGNHEELFLRAAADPGACKRWIGLGGDATLASYGAYPDLRHGPGITPRRLRQMIRAHVPDDHLAFLAGLPLSLTAGRHVFAHAGIDPRKPPAAQDPRDLLWGDPARADRFAAGGGPGAVPGAVPGVTVVHGHVPLAVPLVTPHRINVDTGAWRSGILSAVLLRDGAPPEVIAAELKR